MPSTVQRSKLEVPIELQRRFWNKWNTARGDPRLDDKHVRQAKIVVTWLQELGRTDLRVIEVGCGSAWFTPELARFGIVVATDLADESVQAARERLGCAEFIAGDFMELEIAKESFDVAVVLEVLAHVADQPGFIAKLADVLRPGGYLMLATQNRPVLQNFNRVRPAEPGQLRNWTSASELRALLGPRFHVDALFSVTLRGPLSRIARVSRSAALFERFGFGWTLMVRAQRRTAALIRQQRR